MLIYSDSVIVIYHLEGMPTFKARATARLNALWLTGDTLVVSDLVRLECRVLPIRMNNPTRLADFDTLFAQPNVRTIPITSAAFERATTIRARYNFKLADSLHLAAATEARCDRFLTNDPHSRHSRTSSWKCCRKQSPRTGAEEVIRPGR